MTWKSIHDIQEAVVACDLCPRLRSYCGEIARKRKREFADQEYWGRPVPGFGDPDAELLVIGLAPAAHGGNRTGRIFTGDSSGDWLYEALHRFGFASQSRSMSRDDGMKLIDCYIVAVGRCAPPDNKPLPEELRNCRVYLEEEIRLLKNLRIVVTLGRIAHENFLRAAGLWDEVKPSERPSFAHDSVHDLPCGRTLISSFHPSRQNTNTGKLTRSMWHSVFRRARSLLAMKAS